MEPVSGSCASETRPAPRLRSCDLIARFLPARTENLLAQRRGQMFQALRHAILIGIERSRSLALDRTRPTGAWQEEIVYFVELPMLPVQTKITCPATCTLDRSMSRRVGYAGLSFAIV